MTSFYDRALPDGGSGYFSEPSPTLDPNLFIGTKLRPEVRFALVDMLTDGLTRYLDLTGVNEWLHAYLAGSGITYQWSADRGNGDLDVLFGVDMARFVHWNPDYQGIPEGSVADHTDNVLKQKLWPKTAHTRFGQQVYEATFFWAAGIGQGIERIHPYAAYDLKRDVWVVPPPSLPDDPHALYSSDWYDAARRDVDAAETIARRHASLSTKLASTASDQPAAVNYSAQLTHVQAAARALFEDIHGGRREAFGEQGSGYSDWHNFRWQHAKETGVIAGLRNIMSASQQATAMTDAQRYGGPISGPDQILTRDMLDRGNHPYLR
jgi:hypothetical protein